MEVLLHLFLDELCEGPKALQIVLKSLSPKYTKAAVCNPHVLQLQRIILYLGPTIIPTVVFLIPCQ